MSVPAEKIYQAVKSGRVKIDDLNGESKQALHDYVAAKNNVKPVQKSLQSPASDLKIDSSLISRMKADNQLPVQVHQPVSASETQPDSPVFTSADTRTVNGEEVPNFFRHPIQAIEQAWNESSDQLKSGQLRMTPQEIEERMQREGLAPSKFGEKTNIINVAQRALQDTMFLNPGETANIPAPTTGNAIADVVGSTAGSVMGLMAPGPGGLPGSAGGLLQGGALLNNARYLPLVNKLASKLPASVLGRGGEALGHALPFFTYGAGRTLANQGSLGEATKQGLIEGAAGFVGGMGGKVIGEQVPALTGKILPMLADTSVPEAVGHYVGNIARGGITGAGMTYGTNLANQQPLDNATAAKDAAIFALLEAVTGGRYRPKVELPFEVPQTEWVNPNKPNNFVVDQFGNVHVGEPRIQLPEKAGPDSLSVIDNTITPESKVWRPEVETPVKRVVTYATEGRVPEVPYREPKQAGMTYVPDNVPFNPKNKLQPELNAKVEKTLPAFERMLNDIRPDVEREIGKVYVPGYQPSPQQFERFVRDIAISKGYDYDKLASDAGQKVEPAEMTLVEGQVKTPQEKQLDLMDREIKSTENYLNGAKKEMSKTEKEASKEGDIVSYVRSRGGIRPSESLTGEYNESIPLALKNKNGLPLDELASELGMDSRQLLDELNKPKSDSFRASLNPEIQAIENTLGTLQSEKQVLAEEINKPRVKNPGEYGTISVPAQKEASKVTNLERINAKTWYHGTGNSSLTAETLDPLFGNHQGLFGHGIYLTDSPDIANGYAKTRSKRTKTPTTYEVKVKVDKVLDLEQPITEDVANVLRDSVYDDFKGIVDESAQKPGATPESVIQDLRKAVEEHSHETETSTNEYVEMFQDMVVNLKNAGYDALTHTGGLRTGKKPHQVLIMLDPNDAYAQSGRNNQVVSMNKVEAKTEASKAPVLPETEQGNTKTLAKEESPAAEGNRQESVAKPQEIEYSIPTEQSAVKEEKNKYVEGQKGNDNVSSIESARVDNSGNMEESAQTGQRAAFKKGIGKKVAEIRALAKSGKLTMDEANKFNATNDITSPTKRLIINDVNEAMKKGLNLPDSEISFEQWYYRRYGQDYPGDNATYYKENFVKNERQSYRRFINKAKENKATEFFSEIEQAARERIKSRKGRLMSGIPLDDLTDYTIIGAAKIAKGTVKYSQWAAEMVKEFGAKIAPRLKEVYAQAKELHGRYINGDEEAIAQLKDLGKEVAEDQVMNSVSARVETPKAESVRMTGNLPDTRGNIVSKTDTPPISLAKGYQLLHKGYIKMVDDFYRVKEFVKNAEKVTGQKLSAEDDAYILGLNTRNDDIITKKILTDKLVDPDGNVIGEGLGEITNQIPKDKVNDFQDYLIHKHAPAWLEQGRKVFPEKYGITPDKEGADISRQIAAKYEAENPEFKGLANRIYKFNDSLIKTWLVDTGVISDADYQALKKKYPNYIPLNRLMDDNGIMRNTKRGFANQRNPVKPATGSERPIVEPLESIIDHIDSYVKTANRNRVMQKVIETIRKDPEALEGWASLVDEQSAMNFRSVKEVNKILSEEGIDGLVDKYNQQLDEMFNKSRNVKNKVDEVVVTGLINGEPVHVKINDPEFLEALTTLSPMGQNTVLDALGAVTNMMKTLTTGINPMFGLFRNVFRDIPAAYIFSKSTDNPIVFGKDLIHAFASTLADSAPEAAKKYKWVESLAKLHSEFQSAGGGHSSPISANRNLLAESKAKILPGYFNFKEHPFQSTKRAARHVISYLEALNNAVEAAPRMGEYKRFTEKGDKTRGIYEAQDVTTNFKKRGKWGKELDNIFPFFNAAVQGLDKLRRTAISKDGLRAAKKAFLVITIPSILLYLRNHDSPNYQKESNYNKDAYFLWEKPDGKFIKIPKPRELGVLFGSSVERALREWEDKDPEAFKGFWETVKANFLPPLRTIVHPAMVDLPSNKDFIDRPIVPGYLQGVSPEQQYGSKTSEVSKELGKLFNWSPKKIDYMARSYLGVIGQIGIPATSEGATIGDTIEQQFTTDPIFSNDILNDFYSTKSKLDTAYNDFRQTKTMTKQFNPVLRTVFNKGATQLSKIQKIIRNIESSNLSADVKERRIRELKQLMLNIAENMNAVAERIGYK